MFRGDRVDVVGENDYVVTGDLTITGVTHEVPLRVEYLGMWPTPWWEEVEGEWVNKGPRMRAGFQAKTEMNRHDFGVSWNDKIDRGGVIVGDIVHIAIAAAELCLDMLGWDLREPERSRSHGASRATLQALVDGWRSGSAP
jgi:polyisoprenoid-binding protein YceI